MNGPESDACKAETTYRDRPRGHQDDGRAEDRCVGVSHVEQPAAADRRSQIRLAATTASSSPTTGSCDPGAEGYRATRLPAGITFFGRAWSEPARSAYAYEQATPSSSARIRATTRQKDTLMAINERTCFLYVRARGASRDVARRSASRGRRARRLADLPPPCRLKVHPAEGPTFDSGVRHQISSMCDDIHKTIAELRAKGVEVVGEPKTESYGITTTLDAGRLRRDDVSAAYAIAADIKSLAAPRAAKKNREEGWVKKRLVCRRVGERRKLVDVGKG